jgi:hemolysin activation/secretion protein
VTDAPPTQPLPGPARPVPRRRGVRVLWRCAIQVLLCAAAARLAGAQASPVTNAPAGGPRFNVQTYVIEHDPLVFSNAPSPSLNEYTGTNVGLDRIVQAASEALIEYQKKGYPKATVSLTTETITNGIVTMHVFEGAFPQVLISGNSMYRPGESEISAIVPPAPAGTTNKPAAGAATTAKASGTTATNAVHHFEVRGYQVTGNTLLSDAQLDTVLSKHVGTNVTLNDIRAAQKELLLEYHNRGYATVLPTLPQQRLTNGIVKIAVLEGRLAEIRISKNRYFSSNNIMRAIPSLKTNTILNATVLQAELDRANANRDRQIYPAIAPGPVPDTSSLILGVKDRLPLHAKLELNNENSPGTPTLRINSSAEYDNLWQREQSLGVQYSISPELYKQGPQWDFYDRPQVANYSAFYRIPIGSPEAIADVVASQPGSFGFNEATRKFVLPPSLGLPELTMYASRSTIDTGVLATTPTNIIANSDEELSSQTTHQDVTVNEGLGFRLSMPVQEFLDIRSTVSAGLDYKSYHVVSDQANVFQFTELVSGLAGANFVTSSQVPETEEHVRYLPVTVRWDGSRQDAHGHFDMGFGYTANFLGSLWESNREEFANIAQSTHADGYYQTLNPSLAREQILYKEWKLVVKADGQWASQPLISNEKFGDGGVTGVRGYEEGEVFGDTGWRVTSELKTPPHVVGLLGGPSTPLTVAGSMFFDYGDTYLLDPIGEGAPQSSRLCGTGIGFSATAGPHWQAMFIFGLPLISTPATEAGQPRATFSLSTQF